MKELGPQAAALAVPSASAVEQLPVS
jgi:hypothetical protein